MLGDVNKLFVFKSVLTTASNVLLLQLKQIFLPIIWIFTEGEGGGIKSRLPFKIFSTRLFYFKWNSVNFLAKLCFGCIFTVFVEFPDCSADVHSTIWLQQHVTTKKRVKFQDLLTCTFLANLDFVEKYISDELKYVFDKWSIKISYEICSKKSTWS